MEPDDIVSSTPAQFGKYLLGPVQRCFFKRESMRQRHPKIYSTLRKRFCTTALVSMGFVRDGSQMVKRGACRTELAIASSLDGEFWRVTPLARRWR